MTRSFVGVLAVLVGAAVPAHADDRTSDRIATCERLRAEAHAEALLLYAPKLEAMAARSPRLVDVVDPTLPAVALQARAGMRISPTEMLQGRTIERIAAAECAREQATARLEDVLALGPRIGELAAARAELALLRSRMADVDALVDAAVQRLEHQRGTAIELSALRAQRSLLLRHVAELQHEAAMLEELDHGSAPGALDTLAAQYRETTLEVDRRQAALRDVRAWRVDVRGGVAAGERADWFAVVEVGYSLGELWQHDANRRALRARSAELAGDSHSMSVRLDQLVRTLRRSVDTLGGELAELDQELADLRNERDRMAALDGDGARELRDRLTIELVSVEARRTYVEALLAARHPYLQGTP